MELGTDDYQLGPETEHAQRLKEVIDQEWDAL